MRIFLLVSFLLALSAEATNLHSYTGNFEAKTPNGDLNIRVDASRGSLFVRLTDGWNSKINGATYEFDCRGDRCNAYLSELSPNCNIELALLTSGNILFATTNPNICTGRFLFEPVGSYRSPRGGAWKISQTVDRAGVLNVSAGVDGRRNGSRMEVSCRAPVDQLSLALEVEELLWKAIAYSVNIEGHQLRAVAQVDGVESVYDNWDISIPGKLLRTGPLSGTEIYDLRSGNRILIELMTVNPQGEIQKLETLGFGLKGSSVAIEETQKRCRGESVVPSLIDVFY
ncbi:MAG: hypothetical protein KDD61_15115 [Bdellovibrionales bacterium]|nr:hypothetical protein [Bdellovibrionales bacterium]